MASPGAKGAAAGGRAAAALSNESPQEETFSLENGFDPRRRSSSANSLEVEEVAVRRTRRGHGGSTRFLRPIDGIHSAPASPTAGAAATTTASAPSSPAMPPPSPMAAALSRTPSFREATLDDALDPDGSGFYARRESVASDDEAGGGRPTLVLRIDRAAKATQQQAKKKQKGEIDEQHEQYALTYCMMLGIRFSVSSRRRSRLPQPASLPQQQATATTTTTTQRRARGSSTGTAAEPHARVQEAALAPDDFMRIDRIVFDPAGSAQTPAHDMRRRFHFKDYACEVFRRLRAKFGISDADYLLSLASSYNYLEFVANSKSGQFFFFSNDGIYLIKTQTQAESKFLRQILPEYYMYMSANEDSLLVRICGMHRIRLSGRHGRRPLHFVILKSVYSDAASQHIHAVYDLKGSSVGRKAKPGETVMKDLDLDAHRQRFRLGPRRAAFLAQLERDAAFLSSLHIMDYSLLVGIHDKQAALASRNIDTLTGQSSRAVGFERAMSRRLSEVQAGGLGNGAASSASHASASLAATASAALRSVAIAEADAAGGGPNARRRAQQQRGAHTSLDERHDDDDDDDGRTDDEDEDDGGDAPAAAAATAEALRATQADSVFSPVEAVRPDGSAGHEVYYFGVIDILQQYNLRKRTENMLKGMLEGGDSGISAISPARYAARLISFVRERTD